MEGLSGICANLGILEEDEITEADGIHKGTTTV
ncbi:hypothetical protein COLO4_30251 [Corchorus olitorius]|uniref:Uncharacterized protein n=1 Tax=Corchorus olitorius TaxID=93759 RepID=A0A1R3H9L0_9ROSI|nr:hypothetical protein COLO4_30251 [Corchorus olitorius]